MTVTAPPRPPSPSAPDPEALIEEARRRARRRRLWCAAAALLAAAGLAAVFGRGHGGGAQRPTARGESPASDGQTVVRTRIAPVAQPGQLTMIGAPANDGKGVPGWYEFSTVVNGRLHPFIRCPYHAEWCGSILSLAWARDGTRIAFSVTSYGATAQFNGLHIVTLGTRRDLWTLLVDPPMGTPSNLEWAPDGSKLVFDASGSIYVLSVQGFRLTRLRTGTPGGAFDYSPSWSADGTRLVFATKRHQNSSISVIDLDGSHRRLIATHASAPAWSPDGTTIAYRTRCGIKLVTPSGKDVTPANPPFACHAIGLAGDPVWSPDGRKIAILGASSFTPATFVIDANGRHLRVLTHATGGAVAPGFRAASWQPQPKI